MALLVIQPAGGEDGHGGDELVPDLGGEVHLVVVDVDTSRSAGRRKLSIAP
ncbi:hypothetical protein ABT247_13840 [Kitasatospora sp. NPDC001539]|uniref:hypothetical protein n=1 Tax=Kitasatospora sp. NPDC001539 TaxID=3154384 RepID=UPI003332AC15